MRLNCVRSIKKPACWLFLSLLLACQPDSQTAPGALTYRQAQTAESQQLLSRARDLYRQSAEAGYAKAVQPYVQLALGQGAHWRELQGWWQQLPPSAERDAAAVLLGFWHEVPAVVTQAVAAQLPALRSPQSCTLTIQPVLSEGASVQNWQQLSRMWPNQPLATLPICFATPLLVDSRALDCAADGRVSCRLDALERYVVSSPHRVWLILTGQGNANYNNGVVSAKADAQWPVLTHELSHAFGFLDEYPLPEATAAELCVPGHLTPNLLFSRDDVTAWAQLWQLPLSQIQLTPVNSCQQRNTQAWRPVRATTSLEHYEYKLPELYLQIMRRQLQQVEQLRPLHYLLALKARERGDEASYQRLIAQAATLRYPPAVQLLTRGRNSTAR